MRRLAVIVLSLLPLVPAVRADELGIAKAALRDGLWEIARVHAEKVTGNEARLVILESLANEGKWDEVGKRLAGWPDATEGSFAYYRAVSSGDLKKAVDFLRKEGKAIGLAEAKMMEADLLFRAKDFAAAKKLWAEVVGMSNATERTFAIAAVNLGDPQMLRRAHETVQSLPLKRMTGLRYGMSLLGDAKTATEGARIVRSIVKDAPDAVGAREALVALAEAELSVGRWQAAAQTYHDIFETWPDSTKVSKIQEGRGWALLKLGRYEDALEAFSRAEKFATDDQSRAIAALKSGDALSEMGRGEEAMVRYREVLSKYPATPVAEKIKHVVRLRELETKGRELYREYRFADAWKMFADVAKEDPLRKPSMDYFEILCLYGQGQDDKAAACAAKLAGSCTNRQVRADATLWLAKFLYNRGEWKESRRLFVTFADMEKKNGAVPEALTWASRAAFAESDFNQAIQLVTRLVEQYPNSAFRPQALLIQGESLIELARFDEAVLVLEGVAMAETTVPEDRMRAQILKADALFAMGADNPARYQAALSAYRAVRFGGSLTMNSQLTVSFKIARTLEKLKRIGEANDQYYTQVVLAYHDGREKGEYFDDEARAYFSRAAFRLADEYEGQGNDVQAMNVLKIVVGSDVPAAEEAAKRIERISKKGRFL